MYYDYNYALQKIRSLYNTVMEHLYPGGRYVCTNPNCNHPDKSIGWNKTKSHKFCPSCIEKDETNRMLGKGWPLMGKCFFCESDFPHGMTGDYCPNCLVNIEETKLKVAVMFFLYHLYPDDYDKSKVTAVLPGKEDCLIKAKSEYFPLLSEKNLISIRHRLPKSLISKIDENAKNWPAFVHLNIVPILAELKIREEKQS